MPPKKARSRGEDDDSDDAPPPAKKQHKKLAREKNNDDEDAPAAKGKGRKQKVADLSDEDVAKNAQDFVRLALFNEIKRRQLKRDDVSKLLDTGNKKNFERVLKRARQISFETLGMELLECRAKSTGIGSRPVRDKPEEGSVEAVAEAKRKAKRGGRQGDSSSEGSDAEDQAKKSTGPKMFILRSALAPHIVAAAARTDDNVHVSVDINPEDQAINYAKVPESGLQPEELVDWRADDGAAFDWKRGDQLAHMGVLHLILAVILVTERMVTTELLYVFLKKVALFPETKLHSTPAALPTQHTKLTLDAFLKELVHCGYLERRKPKTPGAAPASDGSKDEWRWGPRAEAEIGEQNVAKFISAFMLPEGAAEPERKKLSTGIHKAAGSKLLPLNPPPAADDDD